MSRTKPTAKADESTAEQAPKQAEEQVPASTPVESAPAEEQASAAAPDATAPESASPTEPGAPVAPVQDNSSATEQVDAPATVTARVLCAGAIGSQRFAAGVVIEGVPADVAKAHAAVLDPHPAAVRHAVLTGAQVVVYEEA